MSEFMETVRRNSEAMWKKFEEENQIEEDEKEQGEE